jgi:Na+/H+-dicarboxylate symporter
MNALHPGSTWRGHLQQLEQAVQRDRRNAPVARVPGGSAAPNSSAPSLSPVHNLSSYVPETLIDPFVKNSIIMIVLIGVFTGSALRRVKDRQLVEGENSILAIERGVGAIFQILIQMLEWLVRTVPFAVFGAVAKVVGESGFWVFSALWVFLVTIVLGLAIHALLYYPLVAWLVGKKTPRQYLGVGADAVITGFSCNSSLATVPVTLRCLEKMGVSQQSARLSACVGTNLNNDGITLYEAMAALFLAQAVGFDLDLSQQFGVIVASLMTGIGIAGIPEAGLIILPLVLSSVGLPEPVVAAAIPLVLPVDWIIARCRSAVNVLSDMLVAILLDRFE